MSLPEPGSFSLEPEGNVPAGARQLFSGARRACPCRSQAPLLWSQREMSLPEPGSSSLEPKGNVPAGARQLFSGARRGTSKPHGVLGSKEFPTFVFLRFLRWFRGESYHVTANMPLFLSSAFWLTAASKLEGCNIARFINTRSYAGKVVIGTDVGRLYWPYKYRSLTLSVRPHWDRAEVKRQEESTQSAGAGVTATPNASLCSQAKRFMD